MNSAIPQSLCATAQPTPIRPLGCPQIRNPYGGTQCEPGIFSGDSASSIEQAGEQHSRVVLEAFSVGHDLNRGTASFSKNAPRTGAHQDGRDAASAAETTASPYPADEYTAVPIPLTPTTRESEAA